MPLHQQDEWHTQRDDQDVVLVIHDHFVVRFGVAAISTLATDPACNPPSLLVRRSSRKDCVKQHMRRRHQDFAEHPVVTLPLKPGSPRQSSSDESGLDPSPSPDQVPATPSTFQQQLEPGNVWPPQQTLHYAEPSSQSWNWYGQPAQYNLQPTFAFSPPYLHIAPVSMPVPATAAV
ncbi:hypothetical protein FRC05_010168 [Tulasnella sp. 425]|nr:hypothetical protein FRC05_010168 [Tulasnella sp. 425]